MVQLYAIFIHKSNKHIILIFIDYLLDDLQSSVARSKSKDMQYLSPSNTTTVVRERSISPGGGVSISVHSYLSNISSRILCTQENRKIYKTARYEYSSSTGGEIPQHDVQQKINSLDSLLLDLKHEREQSLDRGNFDIDLNFGACSIITTTMIHCSSVYAELGSELFQFAFKNNTRHIQYPLGFVFVPVRLMFCSKMK